MGEALREVITPCTMARQVIVMALQVVDALASLQNVIGRERNPDHGRVLFGIFICTLGESAELA